MDDPATPVVDCCAWDASGGLFDREPAFGDGLGVELKVLLPTLGGRVGEGLARPDRINGGFNLSPRRVRRPMSWKGLMVGFYRGRPVAFSGSET